MQVAELTVRYFNACEGFMEAAYKPFHERYGSSRRVTSVGASSLPTEGQEDGTNNTLPSNKTLTLKLSARHI